jgi:NAD(P)-dependent dehydrogenase (short-subunit alcohol dehydrogenase family)
LAEAAHGPIDGLFANAGTGGEFAPFLQCSDENWDNIIATNLTGVFTAMRRVLPGIIEKSYGSIVLTGIISSERGMANNPAHVASKHAVLGLAACRCA